MTSKALSIGRARLQSSGRLEFGLLQRFRVSSSGFDRFYFDYLRLASLSFFRASRILGFLQGLQGGVGLGSDGASDLGSTLLLTAFGSGVLP